MPYKVDGLNRQAIVTNFESTMEVSSHGTNDCSRCAGGILAIMDKFSTYFGVGLSIVIFSMIEQLSVTLQGISTTANNCRSLYQRT